jgi:hypothetical protein
MRLSLKVPAVLLGVPVPESENPYLAVPIARTVLEVRLEPSKEVSFELVGEPPRAPLIKGLLSEFWERLCKGMDLRYSAKIAVEEVIGEPGPSGMYAALTVALLHALAREHGETLDEYEIAEMGRLSDPFNEGPPWSGVVDALRFSVSYGSVVAYRNEEEVAKLGKEGVEVKYETIAPSFRPRVSRKALGGELYNALVKLSGLEVLEAAIRLREGEDIKEVIKKLLPLQEAVALGVWGVQPRRNSIPVAGLPRNFEYYSMSF